MLFKKTLFLALFSFLFFTIGIAQNSDHWSTYTQNRTKYRVVSPLNGKMVTHFVGLQVDMDLLENTRQGYSLINAGFRKEEKTGQTRCFEAIFRKSAAPDEPSKISVELLAFDIRYPNKRAATYQAVFHNLQLDQEKTEVRCQIPVTGNIDGNMAFVLTAKPPFNTMGYKEYKTFGEAVLFNGPWDDDEKKEIFLYAPVAGFKDYENQPLESSPKPKEKQNTKKPLLSGQEYNDYGFPVSAQLAYWSKKGSNYASSYSADGKTGMKTKDGTILIPAQYDQIHFEFCGFMIASKNGKTGVVNEANEVVIPFKYHRLELLYKTLAFQVPRGVPLEDLRVLACLDEQTTGILNGLGQVVSPFRKSRLVQVQYFYKAARNAQGYILSTPPDYATAMGETAILYRTDSIGAIDANGKVLLPFKYHDIDPAYGSIHPDWVQVDEDGKVGLFDLHGHWLIPPSFPDALGMLHNISREEKPEYPILLVARGETEPNEEGVTYTRAGLIDSIGRTVLPFAYDGFGLAFQWNGKRYFWTLKNQKWGLVNIDNQIVIPFQHPQTGEKFMLNDRPFFSLKDSTNQYYGLLSMDNKITIPYLYKWFGNCNGQLLVVLDETMKNGLINAQGKVVLPLKYTNISLLRYGYYYLQAEGLGGVADPTGKVVVEPAYRAVYDEQTLPGFSTYFKAKGIADADVVTILTSATASFALLKNGQLVNLD